jgi:tetratricopeptide (TPR) repeat protein
MASANTPNNQGTSVQPTLGNLLALYMERQKEARSLGLDVGDQSGDVVPHEVGPVQPIDARLAWDEAQAVLSFYAETTKRPLQAPPQWSHVVAAHEPATALPFAVGNFPQLVRNFQALTNTADLATLRPTASRPVHAPTLVEWADKQAETAQFPRALMALGALRLAKQFEAADALIAVADANVPAEWKAAWANERAALAWQRGNYQEAMANWESQTPSTPVLFNRGMAALFCGHPAAAKPALEKAAANLPETGAWHHLACLYLTMLG